MDSQSLLMLLSAIMASGGLWAVIDRLLDKFFSRSSPIKQLLLGMAHDRIVFLCSGYVRRGWITKDEYDDLHKYLYVPYSKFGGNGLADKFMKQVEMLPFYDPNEKENNEAQ